MIPLAVVAQGRGVVASELVRALGAYVQVLVWISNPSFLESGLKIPEMNPTMET
jgi:hypothetical protein